MTDFRSFTIDSTLELVADHWAADTPDSSLFRNADPLDRVTLRAGLLNAVNVPKRISAIEGGVIDEYELEIGTTNVRGRVRGRDPSALILDSYYSQIYARPQAQNDSAYTEIQPGKESIVKPADNTRVGHFMASQIADDAVTSAEDASGRRLKLSWEVRDYEILQQTYHASGRIIDILRALVAPWNLVDPFKVDILLQNDTVVVKHRSLPNQTIVPQYAFDFTALRRTSAKVRKRRLRKIGTVTLTGAKDPKGLTKKASADSSGVFTSGEETIVLVNDAFDEGGKLVSSVVTTETYRMPDRILLKTVKETYTQGPGVNLVLSSRETIINKWENSLYDGSGAVNSPKQERQSLYREGVDEADSAELFRTLSQEFTEYQYDPLGFKTGETLLKQKFNLDTKNMDNDALTVKTLHEVGSLLAEEITERYAWNGDKNIWVISQRESALSGGHRPGGPGRGRSKAGTAGTAGAGGAENFTLERTFSTDSDATPVSYSNENLSQADLQFIMDMFAATVNMKEYEFELEGVATPWLKRGMIVAFENVPLEDELRLTFPPTMVTEVRTRYDESTLSPGYRMSFRAFGWSTS